jgi:hypothetical protein
MLKWGVEKIGCADIFNTVRTFKSAPDSWWLITFSWAGFARPKCGFVLGLQDQVVTGFQTF